MFCCVFSFTYTQEKYKDTIIGGQQVKVHIETGAIMFPPTKSDVLVEKSKTKEKKDVVTSDFHTVKPGETFIDIAYKYKISAFDLKRANNLKDFNIKAGQLLKVRNFKANEIIEISNPKKSSQFHTVKKGETLYRIALENNISVDKLKVLNGLTSNIIKVGQQLRLY